MKKTISVILSVILLFNLISVKSYAADDTIDFKPQEDGYVNMKNDKENDILANIRGTTYSGSLTFKVVVRVLTVIPQAANQIMETFVEATSDEKMTKFTIYNTVMGKYELFNIDYVNIPTKEESKDGLMNIIKYNVITNYNIMRNLSIAISLFILIYVGIRMAISTTASDKAKYSKMLYNWVASLVLVFFMHFIVIIISVVLNKGLQIVNNIAGAWGIKQFETQIYSAAIKNLTEVKGFNVASSLLIICVLTYYQVKFFLYYLHRTIEINFLILVSPLVTITYSIDKIGDNKAQAFQAFLTELITKSAIQIIHAIVYIVFIASAGVIATKHPILALLFFSALSRAEKITRKIFAVNDEGFQKIKVPFVHK